MEILATGCKKKLPDSWTFINLEKKFGALALEFTALKAEHRIRAKDYQGRVLLPTVGSFVEVIGTISTGLRMLFGCIVSWSIVR